MKKIISFFNFLFISSCFLFPFDIDDRFTMTCGGQIIKVNNDIGLSLDDFYEIKNINTFKAEENGWYKVNFCGEPLYVIFGSHFFLYFRDNNKNDSFLKVDNFDDYIKKNFYWGHEKIDNIDDYFSPITNQIKSIEVPDILTENINGKKIVYDTYDMMHLYIQSYETIDKYYRYNAIP